MHKIIPIVGMIITLIIMIIYVVYYAIRHHGNPPDIENISYFLIAFLILDILNLLIR